MSRNFIKNIIRLLAVALLGLFFMPCFLDSCKGSVKGVSLQDIAVGFERIGETGTFVYEPHYILFAGFVIPFCIILFVTAIRFRFIQGIVAIAGGVLDAYIFFYARKLIWSDVRKAGDDVADIVHNGAALLVIVFCALICLFGLLIFFAGKESGVKQVKAEENDDPRTSMIAKDEKSSDAESTWECPNCGKHNLRGRFCPGCGNKRE